jgi:hypothetical protein
MTFMDQMQAESHARIQQIQAENAARHAEMRAEAAEREAAMRAETRESEAVQTALVERMTSMLEGQLTNHSTTQDDAPATTTTGTKPGNPLFTSILEKHPSLDKALV